MVEATFTNAENAEDPIVAQYKAEDITVTKDDAIVFSYNNAAIAANDENVQNQNHNGNNSVATNDGYKVHNTKAHVNAYLKKYQSEKYSFWFLQKFRIRKSKSTS